MEWDETTCGPLCQHPSCWSSSHRLERGLPRKAQQHSVIKSQDEGDLPTQNVVNLLGDYGPDPSDRYPASVGRRPSHHQVHSSGHRQSARNSFPKLKTPMATPTSMMHASSGDIKSMLPAQPPAPPRLNRVEVQEVFDLEDLHSKWQETFVAQQFYVWVPKQKIKNKNLRDVEPVTKSLPAGPSLDSTGSIMPRDVTESMIPKTVEWNRCNTKQKRVKSPKSPQQGQPYSHTPRNCKSAHDHYYGIYELLDLPKDVLLKVLDHIDQRDLMDRERLAEALTRAFPKLEYESSSLAMAYGDVLQQRKMTLKELSMPSRQTTRTGMEPIQAKQIYLMEDDFDEDPDRLHHQLSMMSSGPVRIPNSPVAPPPENIQHISSSVMEAQWSGCPLMKDDPKTLPQKSPLPSIPVAPKKSSEKSPDQPKAASISLGLPVLPSGVKITRPFMYKNTDFNLALGPVEPTKSSSTRAPTKPAIPVQKPAICKQGLQKAPMPPVPKDPSPRPIDSPQMSDRESSTIHVTMPKVPSDVAETPLASVPARREDMSITSLSGSISFPSTTLMGLYTAESTWEANQTPLHAVSPSYSTHVPKTPAATPATRQVNSTDATPVKSRRAGSGSMVTSAAGSHPPGITPEATAILGTIPEQENDESDHNAPQRPTSDLPKSRRSVKFAPPQPPSSPNQSERSLSPEVRGQGVGAESTVNNGVGSSMPTEATAPLSQETSLLQSRATKVTASEIDTSSEPWPQVDEEAYKNMASPVARAERELTASSINGDPSIAGQYDLKSEPSGLSSMIQSRESSFVSNKKLREIVGESPGPPPPSPEPKDLVSVSQNLASQSKLVESSVNFEDIIDSDSVITISAKPPSNLDDISRIQTPATPMNTEHLRENSGFVTQPFLPTIFSDDASSQDAREPPDGEPNEQTSTETSERTRAISTTQQNPEQETEPASISQSPTDVKTTEHQVKQDLMLPPEITIIPETRPTSEQNSEGQQDEPSSSKVDEQENGPSPVAPQTHAYPPVVDDEIPIDGLVNKLEQLDYFNTTEETFKEELKDELDRLDSGTRDEDLPEGNGEEQMGKGIIDGEHDLKANDKVELHKTNTELNSVTRAGLKHDIDGAAAENIGGDTVSDVESQHLETAKENEDHVGGN